MTPEQVSLVQTSWEKVVPISDKAAAIFYARLFELDPELKPLSVEYHWDEQAGSSSITAHFRPGASARAATFDASMAAGSDYQELLSIDEDIRSIGPAPYTATSGNAEPITLNDAEALDHPEQPRHGHPRADAARPVHPASDVARSSWYSSSTFTDHRS